jgi:hypothetical protein
VQKNLEEASDATMTISLFPGMLVLLGVASAPSTFFSPSVQITTTNNHFYERKRSIDLSEAAIVYGTKFLFEPTKDDSMVVLPSAESLVKECLRHEAAVLAILEKEDDNQRVVQCLPKGIQVL